VAETGPGFPDVLAVLDQAILLAGGGLHAGGPGDPPAQAGDPPVKRQPWPRLTMVLAGRARHAIAIGGRRRLVDGERGTAFVWSRRAWNLELWGPPVRYLGLVVRVDCLRALLVEHAGGAVGPSGPQRWVHTRQPVPPALRHAVDALDALVAAGLDEGQHAIADDLLRAVLRLARMHLADDLAADGAGERTWQRVLTTIRARLAGDCARAVLAREVDLHPNYLSALCRRQAGMALRRVIEELRLERAQELLTDRSRRIGDIARACGYADCGYFIRVFRRRFGHPPGRARRAAPPPG